MYRTLLKSKIHNARVTQANLYYAGSITIDEDLMDKVDIAEYEKVQVVNINNGERFETYVIKEKRGSGVIGLNGPASRLGHIGDTIQILSYASFEEKEMRDIQPVIIYLDNGNTIVDQ